MPRDSPGGAGAASVVMMLIAPPMASEPYDTDDGPRTTSMRSTMPVETSEGCGPLPRALFMGMPSTSTSTRWPERPRNTTRCSHGLSFELSTPGSRWSASPTTIGASSRSCPFDKNDSACGDS